MSVGEIRVNLTAVLLELDDARKKCCTYLGHGAVGRDKKIIGLHLNVAETLCDEVIHHGLYLRRRRRVVRHELAHRKGTSIKRAAGIVDRLDVLDQRVPVVQLQGHSDVQCGGSGQRPELHGVRQHRA